MGERVAPDLERGFVAIVPGYGAQMNRFPAEEEWRVSLSLGEDDEREDEPREDERDPLGPAPGEDVTGLTNPCAHDGAEHGT